jgi:hypothetical protein
MSLSPDGDLQVFTIYHRPADLPQCNYVVRAYVIRSGGPHPGDIVGVADTLNAARALIPLTADVCFPRQPDDDPVVVESWM